MIAKIQLSQLRNPEHFQFITDAEEILKKYSPENRNMSALYAQLSNFCKAEEASMASENDNTKIKEKNTADSYRDKLHSSMFNYLKSIVYNELDPRYDAACRLMAVIKDIGNPTQLAENAESAMLVTLGNRLEAYRTDLKLTGADRHLEKLLAANLRFMELEKECRTITSMNTTTKIPSMATLRKQTDPLYRKIINALNTFIGLDGDESYKNLIANMNVLVDKYNRLLAQRKGKGRTEDKM